MNFRSRFFKIISILSLVVAAYHFVGIFYPIDPAPPWRHFVFVGISLFCCYGFVKRPKYFSYFFFVLLIQQFYSHGSYFFSQWYDFNKIDWISVVLLPFLIIVFFNLIIDLRSRSQ